MHQASPVPTAWPYTVEKLRLGSYPCGACQVVQVQLERWETRRRTVKEWEEEVIGGADTKRNTPQFKNIQETRVVN